MTSLNFNWEIEIILEKSKYPEVILVKKKVKRKNKKRNWKIKRLVMEEGETVPVKETKSKQIKKQELEDQQYEQFLEDIELDKELRSKVNLYRDEEMRKIIEKNKNNEEVKNEADEVEDEEGIGVEIGENELLDDLNFKEEEIISTSNMEKIKEEDFVEEEKETVRIEKKEKEKEKPKEKGIYIDTGVGKRKKKKKEK
jgi:nonsense-mediated mRNA decay protein 3